MAGSFGGGGGGGMSGADTSSFVLSKVGTAMQGWGQIWEGYAGYQDANASAKIAKFNAKMARRRAKEVMKETEFSQMQFADESQRVAGEQLASMGASGNVVSEGANLAVQKEQARQAEIQDFIIGYQGLQEKKRLEQEAVNYDILKNQYRRRGRNTLGAGILSGIGTMLKG